MRMLLMKVVLVTTIVYSYPNKGPFPASFDCPMRNLAKSFAQHIQPFLTQTQLNDIVDALQGAPENQNCTISVDKIQNDMKTIEATHTGSTIYIDPINGVDSLHQEQSGSIIYPFNTIQFGINYFRKKYGVNSKQISKKIYLREGKYYIKQTIQLNENDSNLIIQNYANEQAEISGAVVLPNLKWIEYKNTNNYNIYETLIPTSVHITSIPGLRINGMRGIQSRYPNANPETDGFGSNIKPASWIPPTVTNPEPEFLIHPTDYPIRNDTFTGVFSNYNLGIGGVACGKNAQNEYTNQFSPPAGFWCTDHKANGRSHGYIVPRGITINSNILPNASRYDNKSLVANGAKLSAWYANHWASWYFKISSYDSKTKEIMFGKGGFQTAQSGASGGDFYIENVLEELDYPTEYFFDVNNRTLYYFHNDTNNKPPMNLTFEATKLKVLFNLTGTNMSVPIENVTITGMVLRDTAYTYLDNHGMCSGGDSTYPRLASIILFNSKNIEISNNLFTRIDGNGILLNHYNEYVNIFKNEFVWLGRSGIILWGDTQGINFEQDDIKNTMGYDGMTLIQPRHINVSYNIGHEFGIFVKEHSFYFQTKSCSNYIGYNIIYNAGRFGINFNDGFGGNNTIEKNLIFNTCKESGNGDTGTGGPFNSWDRQVYTTKVRSNGVTESTQKQYDYIRQNFWIANYFGMFAVNMDDGSSYFNITNNFLVYAKYGLKTSNGGHDGIAINNIYAYVYQYCFWANAFDNNDSQKPNHIDTYINNSCVLNNGNDINYGMWNCQRPTNEWPILKNNKIYTLNESAVGLMGLCNLNEKQFQTKYNSDIGTTIQGPNQINNAQLVQHAKNLIF